MIDVSSIWKSQHMMKGLTKQLYVVANCSGLFHDWSGAEDNSDKELGTSRNPSKRDP
jgi:hypothetical protein